MSESFEQVYDHVYPQLHNPCGLWKAAVVKEWLDDLMTAHEREMEAVRDPQRIGGTLERDSFAYAIEQLREFRWQHATNDNDAIPYINGIAKAHEREMEHLRKERFREGYEAGQHSMDAEHYQLKLRLQGLRFDGGSHENLSKLAYAIYPCATGWTCESCEGLRDRLIHLLGGVDRTCPNANRTCPVAVQGASITDDGSDHEPAQGGESGAADSARGDCRCGESQGRIDKLARQLYIARTEVLRMRNEYYRLKTKLSKIEDVLDE